MTGRPLTPEEEQQVERALRSYERRCKRERVAEKYDRNTGSWMTEAEEAGQ